jgi:hypothetical protein
LNSNRPRLRSWLEYVAAGAGAVAVIAGVTYVLGLLALFAPIWRTYGTGPTIAWYATSLVPQTLVAGRGFWQLVGAPALLGFLGYVMWALWKPVINPLREYVNNRWWGLGNVLIIVFPFVAADTWLNATRLCWTWQELIGFGSRQAVGLKVLWGSLFVYAFYRVYMWHKSNDNTEDSPERAERAHSKDSTGDSEDSKGPDNAEDSKGPDDAEDSNKGQSEEQIPHRVMLVLILFASIMAWAYYSFTESNPALPRVKVQATDVKDVDGNLLTHRDGFWYVFEDASNNQRKLKAVPDDQVETVSVIPKERCPSP